MEVSWRIQISCMVMTLLLCIDALEYYKREVIAGVKRNF